MAGRKLPALPSLSAKPELADVFYVVDVSDTSESPDGTSKQIDGTFLALLGGFQSKNNMAALAAPTVTDDSDSGYAVGSLWGFGNNIYKCTSASVGAAVWVEYSQSLSGNTTITPVITAGTGTCSDVTIYFYNVGGRVHFDFFARTFTIANGENNTNFTIDLTGTGFEPDSNFASTQDVFALGRTFVVTDSSGNTLESTAIGTVVGTKTFLISAGLTAVSVGEFSTSISGSGSYSI